MYALQAKGKGIRSIALYPLKCSHKRRHLVVSICVLWEISLTTSDPVYFLLFQDPDASYDVNGHDNDPQPRYDYSNENR